MPTLLSPKSNNWVDRGVPAEPTLQRILAHAFDRHAAEHESWLAEHARAVLGLVAAHGTESHVVGYLRSVARDAGMPDAPPTRRLVAVALWHAAKAALIRDFAERVLRGEVPIDTPTPERLSSWLAERLLTQQELDEYAKERPLSPSRPE